MILSQIALIDHNPQADEVLGPTSSTDTPAQLT